MYFRALLPQCPLEDGAIQDQAHDVFLGEAARSPRLPIDLHRAPGAADHVLAHRPQEKAEKRPLHPARVSHPGITPTASFHDLRDTTMFCLTII